MPRAVSRARATGPCGSERVSARPVGRELARDARAHEGDRRAGAANRKRRRTAATCSGADGQGESCGRLSASAPVAASPRRAQILRMTITVELLHADAQPPRRAHRRIRRLRPLCVCPSALRQMLRRPANVGATAVARRRRVLRSAPRRDRARATRLQGAPPVGVEAQIRPRSGTSFKKGLQIPNAPGHDRLRLSRRVDGDRQATRRDAPIRIEHGERIAQMVLARYEVLAIETGRCRVTTSRVGGFGSTGE